MKLQCQCTYCGHVWVEHCNQYSVEWLKRDMKCVKCKDRNIKFKEEQEQDIFGYNYKEPTREKRSV